MLLARSRSLTLLGALLLLAVLGTACSEAGFNPLKLMKKRRAAQKGETNAAANAVQSTTQKDDSAILENDETIGFDKNIVFAIHDKTKLFLDIAYPADTKGAGRGRPVIVYVHGGGFVAGDRHGYYQHMKRAVDRGYVAATVDYRLADGSPVKKFPAAVKDVAAAVRWIKEKSNVYNVDPDRIGIYGGSAGGNLALMIGLAPELVDNNPDRIYSDQNSSVKAVVNFCGPTDYMLLLKNRQHADPLHVMNYLGGGNLKRVRESAKKASPVYYIDKNDPPVLTLHGNKDSIVPYENAIRLDQEIKAIGGYHRLIELTGGDHPGLSKVDYRATLEKETFRFFNENL